MTSNQEAALTAAECAARTGLTARALRVYEELGLIAPRRSAGGWRLYGATELIRLNTITMLKVAGLSLAQIKTVTHLSGTHPSLEHVLEVQIDTWQAKQAAAARGQAIAETALKNLRDHESLSIDELCNLVRNLEMSDQHTPPSNGEYDTNEVIVSAAVLDKYVGHYRYGEYALIEVRREDTKLVSQLTGFPPREMIALSDTEFFLPAINAHIRFVMDTQDRVNELILLQLGVRNTAPRIDAMEAETMRSRLAAKIASNMPTPGSDLALRRMLDSIAAGTPNYDAMSPMLAEKIRQQLPLLQGMRKFLGAIQAIEFRGIGKAGWDVYEVRSAHGTAQWRIGMRADGIIDGFGIGNTDPRSLGAFAVGEQDTKELNLDTQPHPGAEAAMRRMIDGIRNGTPNYDEMSPVLATAIKQQLPQIQGIYKQLGALVAIEYQGTVVERYDIFEVKRDNGTSRWRISMNDDGTIRLVNSMLTGQTISGGP